VFIVVTSPFTVRSPVTTRSSFTVTVLVDAPMLIVEPFVVPRFIVVAFVVATLNVVDVVVISPPFTARSPVRVRPTNVGLSVGFYDKSTFVSTPLIDAVTVP